MSASPFGCKIAYFEEGGVCVLVDTSTYSLSAIKKAAYGSGNACHVLIEKADDDKVKITLRAKKSLDNMEFLAGEFCNSILDHDLRETISRETEDVRNLLLAHAFSRTSLFSPQYDTADYHDDPEQIHQSDAQRSSGRDQEANGKTSSAERAPT